MDNGPAIRHDDPAAVRRVSLALLRAVNESHVEGVRAVWAYDGTLMPPHHPAVIGRDEITRYFEALFQRGRFAFEFTNSSIDVNGNVAIEHVQYTATFVPLGGGATQDDKGKGLHVFRRLSGGDWQLQVDIWNTDNSREQ